MKVFKKIMWMVIWSIIFLVAALLANVWQVKKSKSSLITFGNEVNKSNSLLIIKNKDFNHCVEIPREEISKYVTPAVGIFKMSMCSKSADDLKKQLKAMKPKSQPIFRGWPAND